MQNLYVWQVWQLLQYDIHPGWAAAFWSLFFIKTNGEIPTAELRLKA